MLMAVRRFLFSPRPALKPSSTIVSNRLSDCSQRRLVASLRAPREPPYVIPFDTPFTRDSLTRLASKLPENLSTHEDLSSLESLRNSHDRPKTAAVLIALCNVDDQPGIILEVRGKLRTHSGEISFPGGKVDKADHTLLDAALRETREEIGVRRKQVQVLGRLLPVIPSLHGLNVHCFVGFIHSLDSSDRGPHWALPTNSSPPTPLTESQSHQPLPSLSMSSLTRSPEEVAQIFHLPLSHLVDTARLRQHRLPNRPPYYAVNVTDLLDKSGGAVFSPVPWEGQDEVGSGGDPEVPKAEVWGLTGWYLNQLLRRLGVY